MNKQIEVYSKNDLPDPRWTEGFKYRFKINKSGRFYTKARRQRVRFKYKYKAVHLELNTSYTFMEAINTDESFNINKPIKEGE